MCGKGFRNGCPNGRPTAGGESRRDGKSSEVKNLELWQGLDELLAKHQLKFHRVAGHSGHPENDRCDELAVAAYQRFLGRR